MILRYDLLENIIKDGEEKTVYYITSISSPDGKKDFHVAGEVSSSEIEFLNSEGLMPFESKERRDFYYKKMSKVTEVIHVLK